MASIKDLFSLFLDTFSPNMLQKVIGVEDFRPVRSSNIWKKKKHIRNEIHYIFKSVPQKINVKLGIGLLSTCHYTNYITDKFFLLNSETQVWQTYYEEIAQYTLFF